jgi:hypothetical protein
MDSKKMREEIAMAIIDHKISAGENLSDKKEIKNLTEHIAERLEKAFPAWDGK